MTLEKNVKAILEHEDGMMMAMNLYNIREMIRHRGFTYRELSAHMGISRNWLTQILSGAAYRKVPDYLGALERVEDAITDLTDARGYMCLCPRSTHAAIRGMLSMSPATWEMSA